MLVLLFGAMLVQYQPPLPGSYEQRQQYQEMQRQQQEFQDRAERMHRDQQEWMYREEERHRLDRLQDSLDRGDD